MNSLARASWRWDNRLEISFPFNRTLVDALKNHIDPHDREWDPQRKRWLFQPERASAKALQLVGRYYPDLEIVDNRFTYQPPPPNFTTQPQLDPDFAELYILPTAPRCVVDAAFKALAREYHPDRLPAGQQEQGHERMVVLNEAYERVRDRVAS